MSIQRIQESIRIMADCGFSLSKVSQELGKDKQYLSRVKQRPVTPPDATLEKLRASIRKRGVILTNYHPEKQTLSQLASRSDLMLGRLADRFGVSRQAINAGNISDATLNKIVKEIHTIGSRLLKLAA